MMIEQLLGRVFATRDAAHLLHLRGPSFAQHMALGEFYDAIVEKADRIIECYQGRHGPIDIARVPTYARPAPDSTLAHIEAEMLWLEEVRSQISESPSIVNLIDELTAEYQGTVYKLRFLK